MSKKAKAAIVIGSVVIIALLATVIVLLLRGKEEEEKDPLAKRNVVVNKENVEEIVEQMHDEKFIPPGYYNSQMTTTWTFATGDAVSEDAYVANASQNTNDVYFDVVLEEDEEKVIYKSPVIPRGSELEGIKLDTKLEAGTYPCVLIYHLVDDQQNTVSTLRVGITINVAR